ncbi:ATPase [Youhaiella tibetensis]|uniref:ATP-binding protein n=1 Tax=Paradevosia tibetensis TaxID=1447062 RepID=A0A5B9DIQ2_9HYPH|nr:ATP-binding protein [Youhaiella tibetensis]QEE19171.1 ATP-binding protein [Youhaiella tibetensis]GGF35599.1 ATPase [Youhaiella tibetensis]
MDQFDIVLALARTAASGDSERARHQIQRLVQALEKSAPDQADRLGRLLTREAKRQEVAPMALEQMRATAAPSPILPGEKLGRATPLPHDRETATPLARIVFPEDNAGLVPVLAPVLADALDDLVGEWGRTEELAALGVQPNMRCLLYGKPGVGKTMVARYIGAKLGLPIVEARLDGLVSSFLGTTARNIGALFDFADRYRCILFLDEFDAIAKARDDSQEVGEIKRVVNALLQCLDARGRRGFTLAATNHEHLLDPAVWRRFEGRIEILPPDAEARHSLLSRFLQPLVLGDAEMKMLVWMTEGMSGADLETLISGGKRFLVMQEAGGSNGSRRRGLLAALRRQAMLSGQLFGEERRRLLLGTNDDLAAELVTEAGLTQREAGLLVGMSQSTISRRRRNVANNDEGRASGG